jgi:hypothetical protein
MGRNQLGQFKVPGLTPLAKSEPRASLATVTHLCIQHLGFELFHPCHGQTTPGKGESAGADASGRPTSDIGRSQLATTMGVHGHSQNGCAAGVSFGRELAVSVRL